jgi:hypothetical protein
LWARIISSPILKIKLSEFTKLVEITCVQVLFVDDEWCFEIVAFIKNKLKNHLFAIWIVALGFMHIGFTNVNISHLKRPLPCGAT